MFKNSFCYVLFGSDAGPLLKEPPGPEVSQEGGANPSLQWHCPMLLHHPLPLQFFRQVGLWFLIVVILKHFWLTHICKTEKTHLELGIVLELRLCSIKNYISYVGSIPLEFAIELYQYFEKRWSSGSVITP